MVLILKHKVQILIVMDILVIIKGQINGKEKN